MIFFMNSSDLVQRFSTFLQCMLTHCVIHFGGWCKGILHAPLPEWEWIVDWQPKLYLILLLYYSVHCRLPILATLLLWATQRCQFYYASLHACLCSGPNAIIAVVGLLPSLNVWLHGSLLSCFHNAILDWMVLLLCLHVPLFWVVAMVIARPSLSVVSWLAAIPPSFAV